MLFSRSMLRTTAIAVLLTLLWAALHPSIINAAQSSTHRVLVCTPNGMEWRPSSEPSLESFLALQDASPRPTTSDVALLWMAPCPFSHAGQILPLHAGMLRVTDPLADTMLHAPARWYVTAPPLAIGAHLHLPPPRAPPT